MRLARTTSNGPSPLGSAPLARPDAAREPVPPRVRRGRLDGDRVGVHAERLAPAPSRPRRSPGSRTRSPRRAPGPDVQRAASASPSSAARHSRVVGWSPVPKAIPGSSASTTSPGCALVAPPRRPDHDPPADPQDREVRLPGVRPVGLVRRRAPSSSPIGRSPNAWRWPSVALGAGRPPPRPPAASRTGR